VSIADADPQPFGLKDRLRIQREALRDFSNDLGREILGISEYHSFEGCVDLRERDIILVGKANSLGEAGKETIHGMATRRNVHRELQL
jgi:hypothetical protein